MQRSGNWLTITQFGVSALVVVFLWLAALVMALMGIVDGFTNAPELSGMQSMLMMAFAAGIAGLLMLPSAIFAAFRLFDRPAPKIPPLPRWLSPSLLIFIFPLVLGIGYLASRAPAIAWMFMPPIHVLAIGLPVLWVLFIGVRGLPLGSPQRMWGVFGSGLVLGPFLIFILEALALAAFIVIAVVLIASQPDMLEELMSVMEWLQAADTPPAAEILLDRLSPYLVNPWVVLGVLTFGALAVPLIEEAVKPIGVWLLWGRPLSPAAGFAAGALSGAGYALFESLAIANVGEDWAAVVVARTGTAVVHILTTAFTGWALSWVWMRRRYFRLLFVYMLAVAIHGLWNGITLLASFSTLAEMQGMATAGPLFSPFFVQAATYVLPVMAVGGLLVLLAVNRTLSKRQNHRESENHPRIEPSEASPVAENRAIIPPE